MCGAWKVYFGRAVVGGAVAVVATATASAQVCGTTSHRGPAAFAHAAGPSQGEETVLISRASGDGVKGNDASSDPVASEDGRRIAFSSWASNLHPDDSDEWSGIYLRDLETGETILVSRADGADGANGDCSSYNPALSTDGRYVAFSSLASNLDPDANGFDEQVFLRDLQTNETTLVSRASGADGEIADFDASFPAVSGDGRYVAFYSLAANLHPDDTDDIGDVFVRDLQTNETILISRASGIDGEKGNNLSSTPTVSSDGRYVAFSSWATNIHPDATTPFVSNVFVRDLTIHETILVSRASGAEGETGNDGSGWARLSADGRYVAFRSTATNLHPDDADDIDDVYLRDLQTAQTVLISRADGADGEKGNGFSSAPSVSEGGRYVAFSSWATNLHPDDTDAISDVFVRDLQTNETVLMSRASGAGGEKGNNPSWSSAISADGRRLAFDSEATNLHPDDLDSNSDVFVRGVPGAPSLAPTALELDYLDTGDPDGNRILEPGETVPLAPSWHNLSSAVVQLAGLAEDFTGPNGGIYKLLAAEADYGAVGANDTGSCRDTGMCYAVRIDQPATRPALHWDAVLEETLSDPEATSHAWTVHVGDSFLDVPRSGLFYSWIETLLHHRVTGGCAATEYCPSGPNTRAQMAVFLLKAFDRGDYMPPACVEGEERFSDVAFDDFFCPWIEDLAKRGVTAGCGGDNYCPNSAVSRGQMAVFLLKTLEGWAYKPPECDGVFEDVPCPSLFANWIEDLVARQITAGCSAEPLLYCPHAAVTRDQMAVFLGKTFGLALYGP